MIIETVNNDVGNFGQVYVLLDASKAFSVLIYYCCLRNYRKVIRTQTFFLFVTNK